MDLSLADMLRNHVERTPDAVCLIFEAERLTFHDLDLRSSRLGNALLASAIQPGDRVAILSHTSPLFFELVFACAKIGAIMMPLNWRLSAAEIANILADGTPRLILVSDELADLLPTGPHQPYRIEIESSYKGWRDAAGSDNHRVPGQPDDPLLLLYTSGTTGQPKGVTISGRNLAYNQRTAREAWSFTGQSVNLVAMPLFHIGGIGYGMMALSQGGQTVLLRQPEPGAVIDIVVQHRVTHAFFVPTVIQRLVDFVDLHGVALPSLEQIMYGAAPIGETLLRRAVAAFDCGFSHAYGMTETAGTVITLPPKDHDPDGPHPERLRSCGQPLPWVELALVDPATGAAVPVGTVGEIQIRSAMVMLGYWGKSAETSAAITSDGWLRTGDAAYQDADGYVYIHDRYKDMIVSGGENIYPAELENILQDHPDVIEVAVIGIFHEKWGETPRAYVVVRGGTAPLADDLLAFTRDRLARYKCPTSIVFLPILPRNASGKLLKGELRVLAAG